MSLHHSSKPDSDNTDDASPRKRLRSVMTRIGLAYNDKPGPGVDEDAPPAKGLRLFFQILFGDFFMLIRLNFLFYLFCIPVVTIPAAYCAMTRILINMVHDHQCFLFDDFWKTFRTEFKKATSVGIIMLAVLAAAAAAIWYFENAAAEQGWHMPLAVFSATVTAMLIFVSFSLFPMISFVDLPLKKIIKNAFLLVPISIYRYIVALIICVVLIIIGFIFLPFSLMPVILLYPSLMTLITVFSAYKGIKKYVLQEPEE